MTIINPECVIYDSASTISNKKDYFTSEYEFTGTIYGYTGSTAQAYAEKYGRAFAALDSTSTAYLLTMTKNTAEELTLLTETFTDLLPNEVYNFYVMKSKTAENPFAGENLLYITQAVTDENGGLTISYIPKESFETANIFVAGLTRTDISAAEVTLPEIIYTGEGILVNPAATLNGQPLTEGVDYAIEGGYLVNQPGDYSITIVGTGDYTGSKTVTFTAISDVENPGMSVLLGDTDGDGAVNASDASMVLAEYALLATGGTPAFTEKQSEAADVNKDGSTDASDASSILGYYAYIATGGSGTIEEYLN